MTDLNNIPIKRPTFLKVLLILSFIMCGLMILMDTFMVVISLIADKKNYDQVDQKSVMDQTMFFVANTGTDSLKNLIVEIFSLTGVFLMWRLKKIGYIVYLLAESFLYFEFIYTMVTLNADTTSGVAVAFEMIWPLPLDLAFFIMYATQLKHMTWKLKPVTADTQP